MVLTFRHLRGIHDRSWFSQWDWQDLLWIWRQNDPSVVEHRWHALADTQGSCKGCLVSVYVLAVGLDGELYSLSHDNTFRVW